jgi:uncharacterized protein (TIGR00251 family)
MRLGVRVIPNAPRDAITGRRGDEIVLRVRAPATGGRANKAAARCLAASLGVPVSAVRLIAGERSRHKKFEIVDFKGDAATLGGLLSDDDG